MSWDKELQELDQRGALAEAMGGEEKVARQHHFGKLTIRERIHAMRANACKPKAWRSN